MAYLKVDKEKNCLIDSEGKPFFYLADTWWFALTERTKFSDFKTLAQDRKKKGFNVIQLVFGIPPETNSHDVILNRNGTFKKKYLEEADKKIFYLVKSGIVPCILGCWGYHIDTKGDEFIKNLWAEIVKRYSAYPVIFCLSGEIDLIPPPGYFTKQTKNLSSKIKQVFPESIRKLFISKSIEKRIKKWDKIAKFIKKTDPHKTLLTAHVSHKKIASQILNNPAWLNIDTIQSGHDQNSHYFMVSAISSNYQTRPIINMEPWYEGILGNFDDTHQRFAFWACVLSGAKGHAYGAHGIWQMSERDNYMKHWGNSNWKIAINYNGSTQLPLAKKFLENYDWWKLSPNNSRITPHFGKDNENLPISAEIDKDTIFIYFPDVEARTEYKLNNPSSNISYTMAFINPKNMKIIKIEKLLKKAAKISLARYNSSSDLLVIISKKQ